MAEGAVGWLRTLWAEPLVWKPVAAVVIFGNLFFFFILWKTFAPADQADSYHTTVAVVAVLVGVGECVWLNARLSPERAVSTTLRIILVIGAVAALALALWGDTLFRAPGVPPAANGVPVAPVPPLVPRVPSALPSEQDPQAFEAIKRLAAERAARQSGAATTPVTPRPTP